jgi:hypothetical protein
MEITIKLNPEEKGDRNLLAVILAEIVGNTPPKAITADTVMATAQSNPQTKSEQFETVASRMQTTPAKPKKAGRTTKPAPQAEPNTPVPAPAPAPEPVKVESPTSEPVKVVTNDAVAVSEQPRQDLPEQPQAEAKKDVTYDDIRNIIREFVLEADATFVRQVLEYELDVSSAKNLKPEEYGKAYAVLEKALKNFREHNKEQ